MADTFGIDISKWQGNFAFDKAICEGVEFIVLRGAYACGKDTKFETYYKSAREYGLPIGVYQYSMATTVSEAKTEAEFLYQNVLKGRQFALPIYIDVEDPVQRDIGKQLLTDVVKAWCGYLEERGFWVGIYSSKSFFETNLCDEQLRDFTHWVAQWSKTCTYKNRSVLGMWQFGGETNLIRTNKVAGVVCDQNYMYGDYPTKIMAACKNGFFVPKGSGANGYITGINVSRGTDALVQYTVDRTGTNKYGFEVGIDKNGIAVSDAVYGQGNMTVPAEGFVLSGHGRAGQWLYGAVKQGYKVSVSDGRVSVRQGNWRTVDGINSERKTNLLICYNAGITTKTNMYGFEVAIGANGFARDRPVYGVGNMVVPVNGFVLSGHGEAGKWLLKNVRPGTRIAFDPVTCVVAIE